MFTALISFVIKYEEEVDLIIKLAFRKYISIYIDIKFVHTLHTISSKSVEYLDKTSFCGTSMPPTATKSIWDQNINVLHFTGIRQGTLEIVIEEAYGRYGDPIKQFDVSLSQMLNDILWPDHIQWQPLTDQTLYRTRPFTEFWVVSIEHLRRVWHADRGRLLLRTPGPVPLGLAYVLLVDTNHFPNLSLFYRTMLFEYPSVLSRFFLSRPTLKSLWS